MSSPRQKAIVARAARHGVDTMAGKQSIIATAAAELVVIPTGVQVVIAAAA